MFARIERAVYTLWMLGIIHADLQPSNILYDRLDDRVTIIDFGMAVKIPDNLVRVLCTRARPTTDVADRLFATSSLDRYISTNISLRGRYKLFTPDGRFLKHLSEHVTDLQNIATARANVWETALKRLIRLRLRPHVAVTA